METDGRGSVLKGDYLAAAATFRYIEKYFKWLPELVTEAKIWQLRCYSALEWTNESENVVSRIKDKELTNKRLRKLYNTAFANYLIKTKKFKKAAPYMAKAVKETGGVQKNRMKNSFSAELKQMATRLWLTRCLKTFAGASNVKYRTQFNARIKQSEVFQGSNVKSK